MYWLVLLALPTAALALRPGVSVSRRLLACSLVLLVPLAGPLLAMLVRRARGGGMALEPVTGEHGRRLSSTDVARLGELPPILERLLAGDPGERLAALVALSSAGDAHAVAVLRWTVEHGPSDVVLDAALTLEEIDLRNAARTQRLRDALETDPTADHALAAARAAESNLHNRLADAALAPMLAAEARGCYERALALAPERRPEILERLVRLELAAGRPRAALELLAVLSCHTDADAARVTALRDEAAFAARDFSTLAALPCAPAMPPARRACGEIEVAPRKVILPRRTTGVIQVREVAAAALLA